MASNDQPTSLDDPSVNSYVADVNSDDPQAAVAAQGFNQIGQAAAQTQPVQNIITGQGLQNYQDTLNKAIAGDPQAAQQISGRALGTAMGSLGPEAGVAEMPSAAGTEVVGGIADRAALAQQDLNSTNLMSGVGPETVQAQQQANRARDFADRLRQQTAARKSKGYAQGGTVGADFLPPGEIAYAEGGDVTSLDDPSVSQFLGSPSDAPSDSTPTGLDSPDVSNYLAPEIKEGKYGTPSQQAIAGLEGAAKGVLGPLATGAELASGMTTPEAIAGRAEVNPYTHGLAEAGSFLGSALTGVGEAGLLSKAAEAVGLGGEAAKGATFVSQVGQDAVRGAFETALYQGGEEVHKAFLQDPNQTAETAMADIGLSSIMGGLFGGALGAGLRALRPGVAEATGQLAADTAAHTTPPSFVSELDRPALEAGDFKASVNNSPGYTEGQRQGIFAGLGKESANADEIRAAAKDIGAPVMEGQTTDSSLVKRAEDLLINGPPTYSSLKRQALYREGYDKAAGTVEQALGEGSQLSKAQLGNTLKDSLSGNIEEQYAPIKAMYDEITPGLKAQELASGAGEKLADSLKEIPELRVAPSSAEGQLVRRVINDAPNLQTVNDVKTYKGTLNSILKNPTGDPGQKRIASIILDKMNGVIDDSIVDPALKASLKEAGSQYAPYIKDVGKLSEILGKGKVYGTEDALNFLKNRLDPEQVTTKLFNKNSSEDLSWFAKKFPDQMEMIKSYQKGLLRDAASKSGALSPKLLFNQVNKLEPEVQQALFSKEELSKLGSAETYLRSFPKNYNPSGTEHTGALREFFQNPISKSLGGLAGGLAGGPVGAVIGSGLSASARDLAIEGFIKAAGKLPETSNAMSLGKSAVAGYNTAARGVKSIFQPEKVSLPVSISANIGARDKLKKMVEEYSSNPQKMLDMNANNPLPSMGTAFSAASSRAISYLNSVKPSTAKMSPLDSTPMATPDAIARYNRALDIAQNPSIILKSIKEGNVRASDLTALQSIYPSYYKQLNTMLTKEMITAVDKGTPIPYTTRMALSVFMAQPLDSTMQPASIISAQNVFAPRSAPPTPAAGTGAPGAKKGSAALSKVGKMAQTPLQASEEDQSKR